MLRLQPTEAQWLGSIPSESKEDTRPFLLPGLRVQVRPIGPKAFRRAQIAAVTSYAVDPEDHEAANDALGRELIRSGIVAWEGVGDAEGAVLAVSSAALDMFVSDAFAYLATYGAYVAPYLDRDAEKNGSAGSPPGTGAEATPASDIANSPASAPTGRAARNARTRSTNAAPKRAKQSGK